MSMDYINTEEQDEMKFPVVLPASKTTPQGDSLTKQSFVESCNINTILAKYQKSGVIEHYSNYKAEYGVHTGQTFTEAQQIIAQATNMFMDLPSKARKYFNNSPQEFLDFTEDLDNDEKRAKALELGLLDPDAVVPSKEAENASNAEPELPPMAPPPEEPTNDEIP